MHNKKLMTYGTSDLSIYLSALLKSSSMYGIGVNVQYNECETVSASFGLI